MFYIFLHICFINVTVILIVPAFNRLSYSVILSAEQVPYKARKASLWFVFFLKAAVTNPVFWGHSENYFNPNNPGVKKFFRHLFGGWILQILPPVFSADFAFLIPSNGNERQEWRRRKRQRSWRRE